VGDCWFLSALAVIAERPDLIARIVATDRTNSIGCYEIRLFLDGRWQGVVVDCNLPTKGSVDALAYARPADNQIWVCLVEKVRVAKVTDGRVPISPLMTF
jgi:calpain-15